MPHRTPDCLCKTSGSAALLVEFNCPHCCGPQSHPKPSVPKMWRPIYYAFFTGTHFGCWPWAVCHCQTSPSLSQLQLSHSVMARRAMLNGTEHWCQNMQCEGKQWPCVQCAHARSTTGQYQMCQFNAKSTNGHVSNVPKQCKGDCPMCPCKVNQWPVSTV